MENIGATELAGATATLFLGLGTLKFFLKPSKKKGNFDFQKSKLKFMSDNNHVDDDDGYQSDPGQSGGRSKKLGKNLSLPISTRGPRVGIQKTRTTNQRESGMNFGSVPEPTWQDPVTPWSPMKKGDEQKKSDAEKAMLRLLQGIEAFGCLEENTLEHLCESTKKSTWKAGQTLYKLGDPAQVPSLYVVWKGSFVSVDESGMVLRTTEAGKAVTSMLDVLAVLVAFQVQPCATITAQEDSELLEVPLQSLIDSNPTAIVEMTRIILVHFSRVTLETLLRSCGLSNNFWRERGSFKEVNSTPLAIVAASLGIDQSALDSMTFEKEAVGDITEDSMQIVKIHPGKSIIDISSSPAIYVVLSGELIVSRHDTKAVLSTVSAGRSVGQLEILAGTWLYWYGPGFAGVPFISIRALGDGQTLAVRIPVKCYTKLLESHPEMAFRAASKILNLVSMTVRQYDHSLECCRVGPGECYVEEGAECTHQGIVLHGRLRGTKKGQVVCEFGRGMRVGPTVNPIRTEESDDSMRPEHNVSVLAVRESLVVCVPCVVLDAVAERFPEVRKHLFNEMARKLQELEQNPRTETQRRIGGHLVVGSTPLNSINVAVVPITRDVDTEPFCYRLKETLSDIKGAATDSNILWVRSDVFIQEKLKTFSDAGFKHWISHQEEMHHVMLLEADGGPTTWTKICVHSADMILLVGDASAANGTSAPSLINLDCIRGRTNAQIELVMVHVDPVSPPSGTRHWIRALPEVVKHHHIRLYSKDPEHDCKSYRSDFKRLARWITGTSVGVVFSGGGARGNCIPGLIRALEEMDIPIDMISGASIGAMYGGLYCQTTNLSKIRQRAQQFCAHMQNTILMALNDITWPRVSLLQGTWINRGLQNIFKEGRIEDLWIPLMVVSTDLHSSDEAIHRSGMLWRYVRASMTLTGFLPPITDVEIVKDPVTGQTIENVRYLVDGGYVNNLPVDVLQSIGGARLIIALDVSQPWAFSGYHYGDSLSGVWQIMRNWFRPLPRPIPSQADINSRLAYIGSVNKEAVACKVADLYIRPPMEGIKTLDWHKFEPSELEGYDCTLKELQAWKDQLHASNDFRWRLLFSGGNTSDHPVALNKSRSL